MAGNIDAPALPGGLARRRLWARPRRPAAVDRASAFAVLWRAWMLITGPVTLLLIARFVTPDVQGYYYTFASLVALQSFVELGLFTVILNAASHEWAGLTLDGEGRLAGDPGARSRLVGLGRWVFRWYAAASAVFAVLVGSVGVYFFSALPASGVSWQAPWCALVALTALQLWALPFNTLLEGCGQAAEVNRYRFSQAVFGNLALWAALALGGGLWAAVVWAAAGLSRDLVLLFGRYARFLEAFLSPPAGPTVCWRSEIWPLQWRVAISGLVHYLAFMLFTPVMFRYHGAAAAGRMGMTLAAVFGVQSVAQALVQARAPRFGVCVARREFAELDRQFARVSAAALGIQVVGNLAVFALILTLAHAGLAAADRLLAPTPAAVLLIGSILHMATGCLTAYLRAHRREPVVVLNLVSGVAIGGAVWYFGGRFGATGAALSYCGIYVLTLVASTRIWLRCRAEWHAPRD